MRNFFKYYRKDSQNIFFALVTVLIDLMILPRSISTGDYRPFVVFGVFVVILNFLNMVVVYNQYKKHGEDS